MLSIVIDIALVAVLVLFIISYTKNGFMGTIIKIGQNWMSLFVSIVLGPFVSDWFDKLVLFRPIANGIKGTLTTLVNTNPNGYNLNELFANLPEGFLRFLKYFDISLEVLEAEFGSATVATESILGEIASRIAAPCSLTIARILAHITCFLATKIFVAWLDLKIRQRQTPFFRKVDSVMGFIMGTVIGLAAVFGIVILTYTAFQLVIVFDASSQIFTIYDNSYIFKFMKELDIIGMVKNLYTMIAVKL